MIITEAYHGTFDSNRPGPVKAILSEGVSSGRRDCSPGKQGGRRPIDHALTNRRISRLMYRLKGGMLPRRVESPLPFSKSSHVKNSGKIGGFVEERGTARSRSFDWPEPSFVTGLHGYCPSGMGIAFNPLPVHHTLARRSRWWSSWCDLVSAGGYAGGCPVACRLATFRDIELQ
jgi:hypothetical protein